MSTLIELASDRIFSVLDKIPAPNKWKVLVIDDFCGKLVDATGLDVVDHQVGFYGKLTENRPKLRSMDAVYIIQPTSANIKLIARDFIRGKRLYKHAHIMIAGTLDRSLFSLICRQRSLCGVHSIYIIPFDYNILESRVFITSEPVIEGFITQGMDVSMANTISQQLYNVCLSLGIIPSGIARDSQVANATHSPTTVRYQASSRLGLDKIVELLDAKLETLEITLDNNNNDTTLLILDRSVDYLELLTQDKSYQGYLFDHILKDQNYQYTFTNNLGETDVKTITLNQKNKVFDKFRFKQLDTAIESITVDFEDFKIQYRHIAEITNKPTLVKSASEAVIADSTKSHHRAGSYVPVKSTLQTVIDLGIAVRTYPAYKVLIESYGANIDLMDKCLKHYIDNKMSDIMDLESGIMYGRASGVRITRKSIMKKLSVLVASRGIAPSIVKLILLSKAYGLYQDPRCKKYTDRISKIVGDRLNKYQCLESTDMSVERLGIDRDRHKSLHNTPDRVPVLSKLVDNVVGGQLCHVKYPFYLRDNLVTPYEIPPRRDWTTNPKLIIFVVGGITAREISAVYDKCAKYNIDIILGSTEILTSFLSGAH